MLNADRLVLLGDDEAWPQLAAIDLAELTSAQLALLRGGTRGWARAGLPVVASPGDPLDEERIDYLFWNHDRHAGNADAMRAYLQWETELPAQIAADGLAGFRIAAPMRTVRTATLEIAYEESGPAKAGRSFCCTAFPTTCTPMTASRRRSPPPAGA